MSGQRTQWNSSVTAVPLLVLGAAGGLCAQVRMENPNPVPWGIEKMGLEVEIRDIVRLPETRGLLPPDQDVNPAGWARPSFLRELPDGRRFVNDSRGFLYVLGSDDRLALYWDFAALAPESVYNRLMSGFIGFDFHPDFARNGLLYTVHSERAAGNPATPDFIPPGYTAADVTYHNVITEWRTDDPSAPTFTGSRRELLRVAHAVANLTHPMGFVGFNPTSRPGDSDYGLLYTSGSDLGFSNGGGPNSQNPDQTQRLDTVIGAILRIDPRAPSESGGVKGLGDYTIPPDNPFAEDGDPATLGEIYAYGFRNGHRLSWDLTDGTMFVSDIGMNNLEEVNIVRKGENYGWMRREGYFENGINRPGGALSDLYTLPADVWSGRTADGFTYPVIVYDHDEGRAITGGFAYHGRIEALRGKFVFGDLVLGRLFASDLEGMRAVDDGVPGTVAFVEEIQLIVRDERGVRSPVSFLDLVESVNGAPPARADMHLSQGRDGEIYVTSRQDGMLRELVPDSGPGGR